MARGRGQEQSESGVTAQLRTAAPRSWSVNEGDVWIDDQGDQLTIIGAAREWSHLCLIAKDRLGVRFIEPKVLQRRYTLAEAAPLGAAEIPLDKQDRKRNPVPAVGEDTRMMTERQEGYLRSLCQAAGEEFRTGLTLRQASEEITRLRQLTG